MTPISTKDLDLYKNKTPNEFNGGPVMPISTHLDELRIKIITSIAVLFTTTFIGFSFSRDFIKLLTQVAPEVTTFIQIKPGEFFFTSLRVSLYAGLVLAAPIVIWQLSSFILPGLSLKEKKITVPILTFSPILFVLGSLFAYFFVCPSMINFLFGFGKDVISTSISIESFVSFTLMIMAICGIVFLLPIIIFALANVGILNSKILISKWRYAILSSVLLGAILTPTPDPFNMCIVGGILIGLYFISWGLLKIVRN